MNLTMNETIGAFEAKNKLGTLLDWVEAGKEIIITRRGKAVARLVSAHVGHDRAAAALVAAELKVLAKGKHLKGLNITQLKKEGRR